MILYPQLPHAVAQHLAQERRSLDPTEAAVLAFTDHQDAVFTPTGGARAGEKDLGNLRRLILGAAKRHGYPEQAPDTSRLAFDSEAAAILHAAAELQPAEAAKPGVWEFMACVLLCDVVRWRFYGGVDGTPIERFLSGRRNAFQRLWWRAYILHDAAEAEPYWLIQALGEDELVQIMERPFLAGSRTLSVTIGRELLDASKRHRRPNRRTLIRESQKRLRRLSAYSSFEAVDQGALTATVRRVFDDVAAVFSAADGNAEADQ